MRNFLILFFTVTIIFCGLSQNRVGIYNIDFKIDRQLTTQFQINSIDPTIQNPIQNNLRLSDADIDSLKQLIINSVSAQLFGSAECIYRKTKKGKNITTIDNGMQVRGMPVGYKKQAIRDYEKEIYVKVYINYSANLVPSVSGVFGLKKYRPNVYISIKGFNNSRQRVFRKFITVRDFEKLKSFQASIGGVSIANSEVLQPIQIREMLAKSLKEMEQKPNK